MSEQTVSRVRLTDKGRTRWAKSEQARQRANMPLTGMAAVQTLEVYQDSTTPVVDAEGRIWVRAPFDGAGFAPLLADEWQEV